MAAEHANYRPALHDPRRPEPAAVATAFSPTNVYAVRGVAQLVLNRTVEPALLVLARLALVAADRGAVRLTLRAAARVRVDHGRAPTLGAR